MVKLLKELFCKHNFVEKCKIDKYRLEEGDEITKSYMDICISRVLNNHCKKHDRENNLIGGYCDYYYQECAKCGKIKEIDKWN